MTVLLHHAGLILHALAQMLDSALLSPGATFSLLSLGCAATIATGFLVLRRVRSGRRRPSIAALARALFAPRIWLGPSSRGDFALFLLNIFATGALIGWGLWSAGAIAGGTTHLLDTLFGPHRGAAPSWAASLLVTLALFLAYDFSYWVDHWLKHQVPLLWEFHRVHHTAQVLTPLTVFRMHPIDSLVFTNIVALGMGLTAGMLGHLLGPVQPILLSGTNIILVLFLCTTLHLQHSHLPMRFSGWLGHLVFSPAHHQIHHSTCPAHFGSNLGSCLSVWDRLFGTLIAPEAISGKLTFGADPAGDRYSQHSVAGMLIDPFLRAAKLLIQQSQARLPFARESAQEGEVPVAARSRAAAEAGAR
jgi:sterol desaturase/sphingolipid hydroxylase (fatty acid hydroxylase superfamily)